MDKYKLIGRVELFGEGMKHHTCDAVFKFVQRLAQEQALRAGSVKYYVGDPLGDRGGLGKIVSEESMQIGNLEKELEAYVRENEIEEKNYVVGVYIKVKR